MHVILYFISFPDLDSAFQEKEVCIGIVTQIDLLMHITKQKSKTGGGGAIENGKPERLDLDDLEELTVSN